VLWAHAEFPFGMTLDYERKFSYYVAAADDLGASSVEPGAREHAL
jgi:hypothetical protein